MVEHLGKELRNGNRASALEAVSWPKAASSEDSALEGFAAPLFKPLGSSASVTFSSTPAPS